MVTEKTNRSHKYLGWALMTLFGTVAIASMASSYFALSQTREQFAMGVNDCASCHTAPNPAAAIFVAVNGNEIARDQVVTLSPGDAFEIDFHFQGMLGESRFWLFGTPRQFEGTGVRVLIDAIPQWHVVSGTAQHPANWSADGKDATFWSDAWDRSSRADSALITRWFEMGNRPGAFSISPNGPPIKPEYAPVVFEDRGDEADKDGAADHMGADATIAIPATANLGRYQITVSGVGHTKSGARSMVSFPFVVELVDRSTAVGGLKAPTTSGKSGKQLYDAACSGCHGGRPGNFLSPTALAKPLESLITSVANGIDKKMPPSVEGKGGRLKYDDVALVVEYVKREVILNSRSSKQGYPDVPHTVRRRVACLVCHDAGGLLPKPASHSSYVKNNACATCHKAPLGGAPAITHRAQPSDNCLGCHLPGGAAAPIPEEHAGLGNPACSACHFTDPLQPEGTRTPTPAQSRTPKPATTGVPAIAHNIVGRESCVVCHDLIDGIQPVPDSHYGRSEKSCRGCHKAGERSVKPSPTSTPRSREALPILHRIEGREDCFSCHKDGSPGALPASHTGRNTLSCQGCHRLSELPRFVIAPSSGWDPPRLAHKLTGREDCLQCHGGLREHDRMTTEVCGDCHKPES